MWGVMSDAVSGKSSFWLKRCAQNSVYPSEVTAVAMEVLHFGHVPEATGSPNVQLKTQEPQGTQSDALDAVSVNCCVVGS